MSKIKANIYKGRKEKVGPDIEIIRTLPNASYSALGSVVFIDHLVEKILKPQQAEMPNGGFAHPHRGIATFTYLLEGGIHHLDSNGGEGKVYKGGIQWMKAGNGIVHDEFQPYDLQQSGSTIHGLQLWLNLPSINKKESPDYMSVQSHDVPEITLPNQAGLLRILLGKYDKKQSRIPNYLDQLIGHLKLEPGKTFELTADSALETGLYVINGALKVDDSLEIEKHEIASFTDFGKTIKLTNEGNKTVNAIVLAGEPYPEPMIAYGPFVMNSKAEIKLAYSDFKQGKYGQIDYSKVQI